MTPEVDSSQVSPVSPRYLFAASSGISRSAIERHFVALGAEVSDEDVVVMDGNPSLLQAVQERWPHCKRVAAAKSKSSIHKLLQSVQRLVLFWDGAELTNLLFDARVSAIATRLVALPVTKVVNKKLTTDFDVYIGRGSPWGNPFAISRSEDGPDREEVIERYREYFLDKIETDLSFKKGILGLRGLRIACYCKPEACHGDVIADYLNNYKDDE